MSVMEKPSNIAVGLVVMTIGAGFMMFERDLEMETCSAWGQAVSPLSSEHRDDQTGCCHHTAGVS